MSFRSPERGFSLVEILVALTILSVGLLGLAAASATVTRLLGDGRWTTTTMSAATRRIELLRSAAGDSAGCAALSGGSATLPGGLVERWAIAPGTRSVAIDVIVSGRRSRVDTLSAVIPCL
jgi:prepilin-type N-terminal cleavage/methylation domain-containing protein